MNELSNTDIDEIMYKKGINYNGCFAVNELDHIPQGSTIINLNGNSHWTALIRDKDNYYYFDAFGFLCPKHIEDLIGKKYMYSDKEIQGLKSSSCGFYCIAFLKFLNNKKDKELFYKAFLDLFDNNKWEHNEVVLYTLL